MQDYQNNYMFLKQTSQSMQMTIFTDLFLSYCFRVTLFTDS